jgi:hypothetical protein
MRQAICPLSAGGKWDFFAARLRPLADDSAFVVRERLFAGVMHPFHYQRARGWMGEIFREVLGAPDYRGLTADEALKQAFADAAMGPALQSTTMGATPYTQLSPR